MFVLAGPARADLAAIGPVNPQNGFPLWVQDSNGLALELNLDPALGLVDPVNPANPFSVQVGFGAEAFWYTCDALIPLASGGQALLVQAVEAAWATEDPAPGDQFPFQRIRIRVDCPVAGTYVVTYPYGQKTYNVVTPGVRAINDTIDIAGVPPTFDGMRLGQIGPFCVPDPANPGNPAVPAGFIADPAANVTIIGSPNGTNFFRVAGPAGSNLGGAGVDTVTTTLFNVSGKIFVGNPLALQAILTGAQVIPPAATNALGTATATITPDESSVTIDVTVAPLPLTPVTMVHLHFGTLGDPADPVVADMFNSATDGLFGGTASLTLTAANFGPIDGLGTFAAFIAALKGGQMAIVVHTEGNPATGELRGQLGGVGAPLPADITRASFSRTLAGEVTINVFVTAPPTATVTANINLENSAVPFLGDGQGRFLARVVLPAGTVVPPTIAITADAPNNTPVLLTLPLTDEVVVREARFLSGVNTFFISAASSDLLGNPALTAEGFGPLVNGVLTLPNVGAPPAVVTVSSALGGTGTLPVRVLGLPTAVPVNAPVPTAPVGAVANTPNPPTFMWTHAAGDDDFATGFDVEVFRQGVTAVIGESWTPPAPFTPGTVTWWRVRATNNVGQGPWSRWAAFTVRRLIIGKPVQVAPRGAALANPPQFEWQAANNATAYDVEIWRAGVTESASVGTTYTPAEPFANAGPMWWRVRGRNGANTGPWSPWMAFTLPVP
jgi:hypothetical protein